MQQLQLQQQQQEQQQQSSAAETAASADIAVAVHDDALTAMPRCEIGAAGAVNGGGLDVAEDEDPAGVSSKESVAAQAAELEAAAKLIPAVGPALRNLGVCLFARGLFAQAEPYLVAHLSLERERHVNQNVGAVSESPQLVPSIEVVAMAFALQQTSNGGLLSRNSKPTAAPRRLDSLEKGAEKSEGSGSRGHSSNVNLASLRVPHRNSEGGDSSGAAPSLPGSLLEEEGSEASSLFGLAAGDSEWEIAQRLQLRTRKERLGSRSAEKRGEALALFEQAKAIAMREFGRDTPQVARQLEHQGLAHFLGGAFAAAEQCFRDAHDTLLRSSGKPIRLDALAGETVIGTQESTPRLGGPSCHTLVGRFDPAIMRICNNMAIAQCCRGPSVF
mmetsp:Transcript_1830/g.3929  ORF Transcript_1830/g.3929 Transcript_1830/m.3929 type:complete len:388 (+) Transcript_1830:1-1164(+)